MTAGWAIERCSHCGALTPDGPEELRAVAAAMLTLADIQEGLAAGLEGEAA